jgi:DNA-binding response OmpR family regulator
LNRSILSRRLFGGPAPISAHDKLKQMEMLIARSEEELSIAERTTEFISLSLAAARVRQHLSELKMLVRPQAISLSLNHDRQILSVGGVPVHLTSTQYKALNCLTRAGARGSSKTELMQAVYGACSPSYEQTLAVHISKLRTKLRQATGRDDLIVFRVGHGWLLQDSWDAGPAGELPVRWTSGGDEHPKDGSAPG